MTNIKTADGREALKVYSSNLPEDRIFINQLEAIPYTVSTYIQDRYGNATPEMDFGTMTPLEDYELSKDSFTFLRDQLLYGATGITASPCGRTSIRMRTTCRCTRRTA